MNLHISQSLIPYYILFMNIGLADGNFNVKKVVISVPICCVNPFSTMSAEKFRVSNSLQSILSLIRLNEGNYLCLLTAPRCVASI